MAIIYGGVLLFSLLFTGVYYLNSHGLQDWHMTFLFVPSLIAIVVFILLFAFKKSLGGWSVSFFNIGFGWLWCYLCLSGIYAMAKVVNEWLWVFILFASLFFFASIVLATFHLWKRKTTGNSEPSN